MNKQLWFKCTLPIALLFSFRMLGLFLLIPIFTLYAGELHHATPKLMGLALGAYGLSQALLQIPFGYLSDRFGRKPLLSLGLSLFMIGSLVGSLSHSIYGVILARILQGGGAIGSVLIALLADLTPEKNRTSAMAVIGGTIGLSFGVSMIISPLLANHYGLQGIFFLTSLLGGLGLLILYSVLPEEEPLRSNRSRGSLILPLRDPILHKLNAGIFFQHAILTATFFILPLILRDQSYIGRWASPWRFYCLTLGLSFLFMVPCLIFAEKKQAAKLLYSMAIFGTVLGQICLGFYSQNWILLCLSVLLYFTCFNILEAQLPTLVSKQAPAESRGSAMGIYSTSQFLGIFMGGILAGIFYQAFGTFGVCCLTTLSGLLWLLISLSLPR